MDIYTRLPTAEYRQHQSRPQTSSGVGFWSGTETKVALSHIQTVNNNSVSHIMQTITFT